MKLADLARHPRVRQARLFHPEHDLLSLRCDSRQVDAHTAFLALKGQQTDGHRFVQAALAAGSQALFLSDPSVYERLSADPPPNSAGLFLVDDGRKALAELAAALHGDPSHHLHVYGITGTNGKTTTSHLVSQLLHALGRPCGLIGTLGMKLDGVTLPSERTTPEAPDLQAFLQRCVERNVPAVAMEVSSIGVVLQRSHAVRFKGAAFTNLTQDHLDFHGDWTAYKNAKFRLFMEHAPEWSVINIDDPAGAELAEMLRRAGRGGHLITYGLERDSHLTAVDVQTQAGTVQGRLSFRGETRPFRFRLLGRFNLANLMAAVGLLLAGGERLEELAEAVESCEGAPGRFERVSLPTPFTVVVDYAHSPDALENLLLTARPMTKGRLRVLFGCGGNRDRTKRPLMGAIAERLSDCVVLTDDNPRDEAPKAILTDIAAGMKGEKPTLVIDNRQEAIFRLLDEATPGDMLLIAGKGDEAYQEAAGVRHPFDDRAVVLEWARKKGLVTG